MTDADAVVESYTPQMRLDDKEAARQLQIQHVRRLTYWVQHNQLPCPATKDARHAMISIGDAQNCRHCGLNTKYALLEWPE